ncbi:MAG: hypothetical protein HKN29_15800 [Rhodothermales bacterium]|nr:hypothetical protein [Rhodothermales bacterium]
MKSPRLEGERQVLEVLEELRADLRGGGISVEITTKPHRHGFLVYFVHTNEEVREISDPGEVIEYLHGLRDGIRLSGQDPVALLEAAVRAAKKKVR